MTASFFIIALYNILLLFGSEEVFSKTRDYGLVESVAESVLYSRCSDGRRLVQCNSDNSYCLLVNTVLHNTVLSASCVIATGYHDNKPGWTSELARTVFRPNTDCAHYTHTLDTVIFVKGDMLLNLYHHFDTVIHAYISYLVTLELGFTDVTVVLLEQDGSLFSDMWKIFDNFTDVKMINRSKGVCIRRAVLGLPTRLEQDIMWSPLPTSLPATGSEMLKNIAGIMVDTILQNTVPHAPPPALPVPAPPAAPPVPAWSRGTRPSLLYSKRATQYRTIVNEEDLVKALRVHYPTTVVDMAEYPFSRQLQFATSHHILLGVHGAGLTHAAFLVSPAALLELYNAGQEHCYRTLAGLFGVRYYTLDRRHVRVIYDKTSTADRSRSWVSPKEAHYWIDPVEVVRTVAIIVSELQQRGLQSELQQRGLQSELQGEKERKTEL